MQLQHGLEITNWKSIPWGKKPSCRASLTCSSLVVSSSLCTRILCDNYGCMLECIGLNFATKKNIFVCPFVEDMFSMMALRT